MGAAVPVDLERIHDATGGDEEFLAELVSIFLEDAELRLTEIARALEAGDDGDLRRTAHKLKGSSANMGANGLAELAMSLEEATACPPEAVLSTLEAEFGRVRSALESLVAQA